MSEESVKNVVLVHGGFVDGSGWQGVYDPLSAEGYNVRIVENPTLSLEDDVAVTKRAIGDCDGPVVLVGHSYGGVVITEAGEVLLETLGRTEASAEPGLLESFVSTHRA